MFEQECHQQKQPKAQQERQEVDGIEPGGFFMFNLRYQIRGGDIDEVAGSKGQKKGDVERKRGAMSDDAAGQKRKR
jgi:hypothetical protein